MDIMIGNLSLDEMQERAGFDFPKPLIDYMVDRRQESASNVKTGMWHCFDIPFTLVCGDKETATEIYNHLKAMSPEFKEPLQISINTDN